MIEMIYFIKKDSKIIINNSKIIYFILFISFTSIIVSNNKFDTFKSCIYLVILLMYSIYLLKKYKFNELFEIIVYSQIIINIIVLIFQYMFPNISYEFYEGKKVWNSSFYSKNSLAIEMAFGAILGYIGLFFYKRKFKYIFVLLTSIFVLTKTGGATSILILIITFILAYFINFRFIKFNIINILYASHIFVYCMLIFGNKYSQIFQEVFKRDLTLTGRIYIWSGVIDAIKFNPILGTGYETFWGYQNQLEDLIAKKYFYQLNAKIIGAHNGFLDLMLQIGILGTIILVIILWNSGNKLKKIQDKLISMFCNVYYVYFLIFFITERSFGSKSYQTLILLICIVLINNYNYDGSFR